MPHPVIHAEIRSQDPDATRAFFAELFGWTYSDGAFPGYTFVEHAAVEDQRDVRRTGIGIDPLDDGVASHLLLAVEREANVDGQRTLFRELPHRLDEDEHGSEVSQ